MAYLLLIVEPREQRSARGPVNGREVYDRMLRFTEDLRARGVLLASESLKSDKEAVRLEVRSGRRTMIDGPFTESKEMVGGFFMLNCSSRAEALEIAGACPAAEWATVEVREIGPCYE